MSRWKLPGLIIGIVLVLVGAAWLTFTKQEPKISAPPHSPPKQVAKPALHPLMIEAMRARNYSASPIVVEQNLGDQGGYSNQIVSYKSDGLKQYALLSLPNAPAATGGYPVVILDHGYIDPAQYRTDGEDYRLFIGHLARAGFAVVKPDYRGHGRSEGEAEGGHFSPAYAYDQLNLIESLKQYEPVNAKRLGLLGHSLGAHVALRTVVVSRDVKATVMVAGVVGSMNDIFYNWPRSPMPGDQPRVALQERRNKIIAEHGDPKSNPAFWNAVSAINYVSAVSGPIQIHHDEADSTVPFLFSQHLDAALRQAGKPSKLFAYPGDNHQFTGVAREQLLQRATAFFQSQL